LTPAARPNYARSVFVNCPFDDEYTPLFEAMIFTIFDCDFRPVCARERMNSAQMRLDKILGMIRDSQYSIHDLSRTTLDPRFSLPRFNMPFELGIAVGCSRFGAGKQRAKSTSFWTRGDTAISDSSPTLPARTSASIAIACRASSRSCVTGFEQSRN